MRFADHPEFTPNVSPRKMFALGVFGGAYFRPVYSAVLGRELRGDHKRHASLSRVSERLLASREPDPAMNHFGVLSGTSLEYWEERGWIRAQDPRGWVEWYTRFAEGRRSEDDERQIRRWLAIAGPRGRFIRRAVKTPAVKQTLLQWGVLVEEPK